MSLIVTSSNKSKNTIQNAIDAPYHYRNDFRSGMKIPANSEIAVESVKLNRNPTIDYEPGQDTFFWFGERLLTDASYKESLSYIIPSINTIRANLSPQDFSDRFEEIIKEAYSLHPEFDTINGVSVTPLQSATIAKDPFIGFRYNVNQIGSQPPSTVPPNNEQFDIFGTSDWDGTTWTGNAPDVYSQLQPTGTAGGPISLHFGKLVFDNFTMNDWTVGLSRPIVNDGGDYFSRNEQLPGVEGYVGNGLGRDNDQFYDFAVESKGGVIRLYHSVPMSDGGGQNGMEMREIIYYQKNNTATTANNTPNSAFATGAPLATAAISDDITFTVANEKVKISASGNIICEGISIANASFKDQVPKPVGQTCWKMYPTVGFHDTGDTVDITEYRCRSSSTMTNNIIPNHWAFKCAYHADMGTVGTATDPTFGFQVTKPWSPNAWAWITDCEFRELNKRFIAEDGSTAISDPGNSQLSSFVRNYHGINASVCDQYEPLFIVNKNERYISPESDIWQPSSADVLGFQPFSIVPQALAVTPTDGTASFSSTSKPIMSSEHSTFIRVPTLNHQTFNFGTGNPSKILFQVPRFDNSGAEGGALYFQNNDKSFIDLNNPVDITVTDLDVQFVRKDETFAKDLTGSSEVVFFVRKKARM